MRREVAGYGTFQSITGLGGCRNWVWAEISRIWLNIRVGILVQQQEKGICFYFQ